MILVDTSVWIDHFRSSNQWLSELLDEDQVLIHPFVLGELACGNLRNRTEIIALMQALPTAMKFDDDQILLLIEKYELMGRGIGLIDIHILASCMDGSSLLWTFDKRLKSIAKELKIAFESS